MREIPIGMETKKELIEILTPDTTVFTLFIPLTKIPDDVCPIPECFLQDLVRQARFLHEKGMHYIFATDSHAMNETQYVMTQEMLKTIGVNTIDVSTLPGYIPYDNSFNRDPCEEGQDAISLYSRLSQSTEAEYIDKTKVILADFAGKEPYKNVLIIDFDIFINSGSLQVVASDGISFAFTGRHEKPSSDFDTENSMIFVSMKRARTPEGEDIITKVLHRIRDELENLSRKNMAGLYGCFVFSTLCHDPIVSINLPNAKEILYEAAKKKIRGSSGGKEEIEERLIELEDDFEMFMSQNSPNFHLLLHPSGLADGSENIRRILSQASTSSGHYLIHGDYFSPNAATWKNPSDLRFIDFSLAQQSLTERPRLYPNKGGTLK